MDNTVNEGIHYVTKNATGKLNATMNPHIPNSISLIQQSTILHVEIIL